MKKLFTILLGGVLMLNISAQTFSDNFDSYSVGDYIGDVSSDWTTWSGTTGGTEDAQVTDAQASSTPNSAYFSSTSSDGGPQDVVLPFGGEYKVGKFTFECSFFVETDKGAYFNFQAKETIGSQWALDCYMVNDGKIYFSSGGATMFQGTYPVNTWFNLKLDIDLSTNVWAFYIDDEMQGFWANAVNQVASLDIYPVNPAGYGGNDQCSFYIDNVSYNVEEYTLPTLNAAVILVDPINGLTGQERSVVTKIRNLGNTNIESFDITYDYNGTQVTESKSSVYITSLSTSNYTFETPITLVEGSNDLVVTISNINGATDDDTSDDAKTISVAPITPAPGKIVLGEEGTGTWCGWCPRGAVFMDYMEEMYHGYWAGVAVHNGDPMADTDYDTGMGAAISGYPSALVDRGPDIDPSQMEAAFMEKIVIPPTGVITNGATYDETSGVLEVSASIEWKTDITGDWKIACVLTEDGVTGTGSGYNQSNYYAGGDNGAMGGYENLANPVPAADMVYDHVGRQILPGFGGTLIEGTAGAGNGDTKLVHFSTTIDAAWDATKMHIVTLLINSEGKIDNAGYATLDEAIANGYVGIGAELVAVETSVKLYPNPTKDIAYIKINNAKDQAVMTTIYNVNGQVISQKDYGITEQLIVDTKDLTKGIYFVNVLVGNKIFNKKLVVE